MNPAALGLGSGPAGSGMPPVASAISWAISERRPAAISSCSSRSPWTPFSAWRRFARAETSAPSRDSSVERVASSRCSLAAIWSRAFSIVSFAVFRTRTSFFASSRRLRTRSASAESLSLIASKYSVRATMSP